jgi:hypothetical protein
MTEHSLKKKLEMLKARAKRLGEKSRVRVERKSSKDEESHLMNQRASDLDYLFDTLASDSSEPLSLEAAVPGVVVDGEGGEYYLIETDASTFDSEAEETAKGFELVLSDPLALERIFGNRAPRPDRHAAAGEFCFFDIETAGLSPSTYVFLAGLMYMKDGRFAVEQVFARDYSEEEAMLVALQSKLRGFKYLVTYNGDSFDIPFIKTRMAVNRVDFDFGFVPLDLLFPARRVFGRRLPNCRLETVREHLTGTGRTGDIPGRYVPIVYHHFVETGDARLLRGVIYHNRMDLLAMAVIMNAIARGV